MSTIDRYHSLFIEKLKRMKKTLPGFKTLEGLAVAAVLALFSQTAFAQTPVTTIENEEEETVLRSFEDAGFFLGGEFDTGTIPIEGDGTRLMWYPGKAAFRAGFTAAGRWDDSNIGDYSVAFGLDTEASGKTSTAFG